MDGLTYELQEEKLDIVKMYEAVNNAITSFENCHSKINEKYDKWSSKTVILNFFIFILFQRDAPMTPYNHLRSQHYNASWQGQFMYIAQLAPHTTFNTQWVWPCGGSRHSCVESFPRSHPETTFKVYKHFDQMGNWTPVAWIEIQSANHYTDMPLLF